jgi:hypothetical protein
VIPLSFIVAVLDSYEVVRRQLLHLARILPADCELIVVDDGSEPALRAVWDALSLPLSFTLLATGDRRPWTQPRARNLAAVRARADSLVFFEIDHILTTEVIQACLECQGDKLHWVRSPAILDADGRIVTDPAVLRDHGMTDRASTVHGNSFLIRTALFARLGGYDERFCGRYGGDDLDFNARYARLAAAGACRPA